MLKKTILLFSYPTNLSNELCEELKKHLLEFGASRVYYDQEIWIAAIGAKLDLFLPVASCVMNIGSSNCDIALFTSGAMQKKAKCKISGIHVNMQIKKWLNLQYGLDVTDDMIEMIKCGIGQTIKQENPRTMIIQGINRANGQLCSLEINENQLVDVLYPLCQQWAHWIINFIDSLNDEQKEDVYMRGIVACGGTMLLKGLQKNLKDMLPCPIYVTDDPLNTVSQGLEILLSKID